jgi:hypothetical protein
MPDRRKAPLTIKNGPDVKPIVAETRDSCATTNLARPHIVSNNPKAIFTTLTIAKNGNSSTPNLEITAGAYREAKEVHLRWDRVGKEPK